MTGSSGWQLLSDDEREVFDEVNFIRTCPDRYARTIAAAAAPRHPDEDAAACDADVVAALKGQRCLCPVISTPRGLVGACRELASLVFDGPEGAAPDYDGVAACLKKHGRVSGGVGWAVSTGPSVRQLVLRLLRAEDARAHLVNPDFSAAAVCVVRRGDELACVVVFAGLFVGFEAASPRPAPPLPDTALLDSQVHAEVCELRAHPAAYAALLLEEARCLHDDGGGFDGERTAAALEEAAHALHVGRLPPLAAGPAGMVAAARAHAEDLSHGRRGHTGSDGSGIAARLGKHGRLHGRCGEVVAYGSLGARDVVVSLLVDGDDAALNRAVLLCPTLRMCAVASGSHADAGTCCVVVFAETFFDSSAPRKGAGAAAKKAKAKGRGAAHARSATPELAPCTTPPQPPPHPPPPPPPLSACGQGEAALESPFRGVGSGSVAATPPLHLTAGLPACAVAVPERGLLVAQRARAEDAQRRWHAAAAQGAAHERERLTERLGREISLMLRKSVIGQQGEGALVEAAQENVPPPPPLTAQGSPLRRQLDQALVSLELEREEDVYRQEIRAVDRQMKATVLRQLLCEQSQRSH